VTALAGRATLIRLCRDRIFWANAVDTLAILLALSLPWSTSLTGIFAFAMLLAMGPFLDVEAFLASLRRPIAFVPIAFFLLALIGTLWSDAPWGVRLYAIFPTAKLLVLPVLFYQFERSERGLWVLISFLVSCALLMVMTWIVAFVPALTLKQQVISRGIFVKNYIDQSQEFTLCAVALAYPVIMQLREGRIKLSLLLGALALGFVVTMAYVIVSRTALVTMPIMVAVFGLMHLRLRTNLLIFGALVLIAAIAWVASPQFEGTISSFRIEYQRYAANGANTSIGERLQYWEKSLRFFADAPLIGHGTGSAQGLFERAASGTADMASSWVVRDPHNQTLNVAIQWGAAGIAVLYAMWLLHLLLFRGEGLANWIGLLVVVQNFFTSLFNSHLFDFHEGWMYVLGVGVAGGMVLKGRNAGPKSDGGLAGHGVRDGLSATR
jgi:O-antigen ligase